MEVNITIKSRDDIKINNELSSGVDEVHNNGNMAPSFSSDVSGIDNNPAAEDVDMGKPPGWLFDAVQNKGNISAVAVSEDVVYNDGGAPAFQE